MELQQGFVLTRHWHDTPEGTCVEFWLATDTGPRLVRLAPQESVAFIPLAQAAQARLLLADEAAVQLKALRLKDFELRPMLGLYTRQHRQLMQLEQRLRSAGIDVFEADIRPPERYLMERFITAPVQFTGQPDAEGMYHDAQLKPLEGYRPALRLVSLDIETSERGELYSIALEGCGQRQVYMLGPANGDAAAVDFELHYCEDRAGLLQCLNQWMARHDPDAIIGWNLVQFDLRLLHEHARQLQVPLTLGRAGAPMTLRSHAGGGHVFAEAPGRLLIGGIGALRSAAWTDGVMCSTRSRTKPLGMLPDSLTLMALVTAPQELCPRITINGTLRTSTANSSEPRLAGSRTWPAVRTTNMSPNPTSKMISAASRESEQPKMTAKGSWPEISFSRRALSWLGCSVSSLTKRIFPALSFSQASLGDRD